MLGRKIILTGIVGTVLLACSGQAIGGSFVLGSSISLGHQIAQPIMPEFRHRPLPKKQIFIPLHQRSFLKRRPHHHKLYVLSQPCKKQIAVNLVPTVTTREIAIEPETVTVWITNSNGSQTSVSLRRSGPGFVGPRDEWYPDMPTEEQLRMVYGF
jgi:hypothetical protein